MAGFVSLGGVVLSITGTITPNFAIIILTKSQNEFQPRKQIGPLKAVIFLGYLLSQNDKPTHKT